MADYSVIIEGKLNGFDKLDSVEQKINALNGQRISIDLDLASAEKQINSFISNIQNRQIQLNVSASNMNLGNIQKQIQNVTKQISSNISNSFGQTINSTKITDNLSNGTYDARLSTMRKQLSAFSGQSTANLKKATTALNDYQDALSNIQKHYDKSDPFQLGTDELEKNISRIKQASDTFKNAMTQVKNESSATLSVGVATKASNDVVTYMNNNTKAVKKYGTELQDLAEKYKQVQTVGEKLALDKQFSQLKSQISSEGLSGKSWWDDTKRGLMQIGQFAGIYGLLQNTVMELPGKMVDAVKDVDSAMTNLYKVTDETTAKYKEFQDSAGNTAKTLGRDMSSYIEQTANWSKLGYNFKDSQELAKVSSIYANVGEVDDETAVSDMVTAMKAFNLQASDAVNIIDQLNILGNSFATSSKDLGAGLSKSASSLAAAGNDIQHSLAMITGMSEITQSSVESANALRILSMRVRGYDEETESYSNDVEVLNGKIADLTKTAETPGGIILFTDDTKQTYKDTYEFMAQISKIYDKLSDKNQAELLEVLAGKNRGNQIAALLQAFKSGQVQKAYETALNSEGSAQQEQDRWLDSIEAKQQQLQASFQSFANTFLSSDLFKGLLDAGSNFLELLTQIIDKFGSISTLIAGLGAAKTLKSVA